MKTLLKITIFFYMSLLLNACATPKSESMNKLRIGMDKTEVIDHIGSPSRSKFSNGFHQWIYIYYIDNKKLAKRLTFKKDLLVKVTDFNVDEENLDAVDTSQSFKEYEKKVEQQREENAKGFKNLEDE